MNYCLKNQKTLEEKWWCRFTRCLLWWTDGEFCPPLSIALSVCKHCDGIRGSVTYPRIVDNKWTGARYDRHRVRVTVAFQYIAIWLTLDDLLVVSVLAEPHNVGLRFIVLRSKITRKDNSCSWEDNVNRRLHVDLNSLGVWKSVDIRCHIRA